MNLKKVLFSALMLTATGAAVAVTEPETNVLMGGVISGRVVDAEHQALPGATIMVEDLHTGVTSDVNGFYTLPNMKPGTYKVKVSYVGYSPKTYVIKLVGKNVERNIILSEGNELKEVVVNGAFYGQRKALQMQKENMGVTNVVSADQVGKFPDSNIGDALKRINGINVQYDQGEARFGQVRGTSADLTSVTVNGNRIPSAEGDTRNVQLDLIPADMVQTIEVNKVVTSDMDGDAIGGEINLVTKNTPSHRVLNFNVGSGYTWVSGKPQLDLGATWGDRFFKSEDGGETWTEMTPGNRASWGGPLIANYLQDGGHSWIRDKAIHWSGCIALDPRNSDQFWVVSGNGVFTCEDTWAECPTIRFAADGIEEVVSLDFISRPGKDPVSVIGDYDGFYHNADGTATQLTPSMNKLTDTTASTGGIAYCPANPDVMVRLSEGSAKGYYTTDGTTWQELPNIPCSGAKAAINQLEDGSYRILVSSSGKISYTDDFGKTWSTASTSDSLSLSLIHI